MILISSQGYTPGEGGAGEVGKGTHKEILSTELSWAVGLSVGRQDSVVPDAGLSSSAHRAAEAVRRSKNTTPALCSLTLIPFSSRQVCFPV